MIWPYKDTVLVAALIQRLSAFLLLRLHSHVRYAGILNHSQVKIPHFTGE